MLVHLKDEHWNLRAFLNKPPQSYVAIFICVNLDITYMSRNYRNCINFSHIAPDMALRG